MLHTIAVAFVDAAAFVVAAAAVAVVETSVVHFYNCPLHWYQSTFDK